MAGIGDMFKQIGQSLKGKPKTAPTQTSQGPSAQAGPGMPAPPSKGFDFNLYMQALQNFANDFFGKQVPEFFKNMGPKLKNFPVWWKQQKQDEQLAYGGVVLGSVMMIVGVVLLIVL